jgi:hypothetical protein
MEVATNIEKLMYPIGKFVWGKAFTAEDNKRHIDLIETFPEELGYLIQSLSKQKLLESYRPGGWNGCQLVHHLADIHINAFMRIKLALTENNPTIKPFDEKLWSLLADANDQNLTPSLNIISGISNRLVTVLRSLPDSELNRTFRHPELNRNIPVREFIAQFAFHSNHHLEHLKLIQSHE